MKEELLTMREKERKLYELIIHQARENFRQAAGWENVESGYEYRSISLKRTAHCEALVEVLEVYNCGSVGGFDKGQTGRSLKDRINWLEEKLNK